MFVLVDTAIILLVLGLARSGWRRGFTSQAIDLVGFTVALLAAVRLYGVPAAAWRWIGFSDGTAALAGGLTIFVPLIVVVAILGAKAARVAMAPGLRTTNRFLGVGFGALWAAVVLTFLLFVTQVAPVPLGLADAVRRSPTATTLLRVASPVTGFLEEYAADDAERLVLYLRQSLRNLTTSETDEGSPEATEEPPMRFEPASPDEIAIDREAERELWRLVNDERTKRGLDPLEWDERLARAGRSHSRDMYVNGYFAHTSPDGTTPAERVRAEDVTYRRTAENLALAPNVGLAHDGLMRSPGHRENILDPGYSRLGIGIYVGPRGLIASQEFCGGC